MKIKNSIKIKKPLLNNSLRVYYYQELKQSLEQINSIQETPKEEQDPKHTQISKVNNFLDLNTDLFPEQEEQETIIKESALKNEHQIKLEEIKSGKGKL
jgi:hypothetical protein